jgi:hypothetical protein
VESTVTASVTWSWSGTVPITVSRTFDFLVPDNGQFGGTYTVVSAVVTATTANLGGGAINVTATVTRVSGRFVNVLITTHHSMPISFTSISGTAVIRGTQVAYETVCVDEPGGGGGPQPPPSAIRPINLERRNPGYILRWLRQHRLATAYEAIALAQKLTLTCDRLGMTARPHILMGVEHLIEAFESPARWHHDVWYRLEKYPGTTVAGGVLYLSFDTAGAGFNEGYWAA